MLTFWKLREADATCSSSAAETVYVTVTPAEVPASVMVSTETVGMVTVTVSAGSAEGTSVSAAGILSFTPYETASAASSTTPVSSLGSIETPTGMQRPFTPLNNPFRCRSKLTPPPESPISAGGPLTTYLLTTTITSGYTPQVVETSTYTVIESPSGIDTTPMSPVVTSSTSEPSSQAMSTASFTLTLESTVGTGPVASASSLATAAPSLASTAESEAAPVFTVTLPGGPGSSAAIITITGSGPAAGSPAPSAVTETSSPPVIIITESGPATGSSAPSAVTETSSPSVITETTTLYSGTADVIGAPTSPIVTDVVMTYTVTDPFGAALITMVMTTDLTFTPTYEGVGTSFVTVSTVTAMNTVTVHTPSKFKQSCQFLSMF